MSSVRAGRPRSSGSTSESSVRSASTWTGPGESTISTGVGFYDHMLTALARHGLLDLRSRAPATCTSTPTTSSRTPRSCWVRRSGRRSGTRRASAGSAMPWCRWTRRWPRPWSTCPAGRTACTPASRAGQQYVLIGGGTCRGPAACPTPARSPGTCWRPSPSTPTCACTSPCSPVATRTTSSSPSSRPWPARCGTRWRFDPRVERGAQHQGRSVSADRPGDRSRRRRARLRVRQHPLCRARGRPDRRRVTVTAGSRHRDRGRWSGRPGVGRSPPAWGACSLSTGPG